MRRLWSLILLAAAVYALAAAADVASDWVLRWCSPPSWSGSDPAEDYRQAVDSVQTEIGRSRSAEAASR